MDRGHGAGKTGGMEPWWQRWFVPERPGLRQFLLVMVGFLAPLPAVLAGPDRVVPALALGIIIGVGLGLGWALLFLRTWFHQAPASTLAIFACSLACLLHAEILPRWELLLRVRTTRDHLIRYQVEVSHDRQASLPYYSLGPGEAQAQPGRGDLLVWTAMALRRWTPAGWRERAWVLVSRDGQAHIAWTEADRDAILERLRGDQDRGDRALAEPAPAPDSAPP